MQKGTAMKHSAVLALVTAAACTLAFSACSDDSSDSTSTTSAKQAACQDRDNLEQSVKSLENLSVVDEGKNGLESALKKVENDLDALGKSAKKAYQPDVDAVKSALDDLKTAVDDFGQPSVTQSVQDVGTAITKVGQTTETLDNAVKASC
jgi:hypothetical protein